ncbi:sarcoplasmic reticulum histidine-rich calcium-binding protein-like [Rhipicephalus sanguineus]|uniref:sarcoplasmic reticulum histidine-rich calcium-binding protein-like n=1 Tax=Rhipicephalus sanguineus TaxID=34632 RepID=UPI0020C48050|nr:sarcoplasmic reticulum histidine-rich calcium-binding protein-like [Rhipicephalus sanguineus]
MELKQLYCLLRANELSQNPGLNVAPTAAPEASTPAPLIRWPSRRPYRQVFYADNASDFGGDEVQPNRAKPTSGEYDLHPDGHRPYRRPDTEDEESGSSRAPPGENDYGDEIDRWRDNYWKKRRYVYTDDNADDMDEAADERHQESGRPPRRQPNRRKAEGSPDSEEANDSGEEPQKSRPYRRRGPSGNAADDSRTRVPQGDYDADQGDVLDNSHRKRARGSQGDYDADEGEASARNFKKRTRGPTRDDEDDQEGVPTNGRRKMARPQRGYDVEQGDAVDRNRRTRTRGRPDDYEDDQERDSAGGRERRTGRPQGGYGGRQGEGLDSSRRKKTRGPPRDYDADQEVPASVRRTMTRGPLGDYNFEKGGNLNSNPRKRARGPPEDYEEDQDGVPADDRRRRTRGAREGYSDNREEALENSYGKRREGARDYDADWDDVPDNWHGGRPRRPQGSYGVDQGAVTSNGRRRTALPRGNYEDGRDSSRDRPAEKERDQTPLHISESGAEHVYAKSYEHDVEGPVSTADTGLTSRTKIQSRGDRARKLATADENDELENKPRVGERSSAQGSDAFTEGVGDRVLRHKRARRRRKNQNKLGDTLLDTTRARDATRQQTTRSGLEDFINFDDDDFTGEEEPSETSGAGGEQRKDKDREGGKARSKRQIEERPALYELLKIP